MTTFLAIWGAALSTLLAIFETIRFMLDRPGLKVAPELTVGVEGVWMRAVVTNGGRRTTTVTEAGFKVLAHHEITHESKATSGERWIKLDGAPKVLDPGHVARFEWNFVDRGFPTLVHADFPLRVYARDHRRRAVWGPALPILRLVARSGLTLPYPPDPLMVEPMPGAPLKPRPEYARWKVWRSLAARDPLPLELRLRRVKPQRWDVPTEVVTVPVDDGDSAPRIF